MVMELPTERFVYNPNRISIQSEPFHNKYLSMATVHTYTDDQHQARLLTCILCTVQIGRDPGINFKYGGLNSILVLSGGIYNYPMFPIWT